ncbi:MAG: ion channel [Gemmatimonadota bacterium]|nr:ion channel [Gemmatimonadota bacterium]
MQRPHRFTVLLVMIVLITLLAPLAVGLPGSRVILAVFGALIPLGAIYAVSDDRRQIRIALALGIPAVLGGALNQADLGFAGEWVALFFPPAFYAYAAWVTARTVFSARRIDGDMLAAAACIYFLIGFIWWFFYLLVVTFDPGAITGYDASDPSGGFDLLYFSFVTLTTLGYGDILPASAEARSLVTIESVTGVLYSGILIAKLVGLYSGQVQSQD